MLFELQVVPLGTGVHIGETVADCIEIVEEAGLPYQLTAAGTLIEGSWNQVMPVIEKAHRACRASSPHVITTVRIEDDGEGANKMLENVRGVEERLAKRKGSDANRVEEASEESFPASDPPGY